MSVIYYENEKIFKLDTPNSSYLIGISCEENYVSHIYYGKKINEPIDYLLRINEYPFAPEMNQNGNRVYFNDCFPWEYSTHGIGDFREDCINVQTKEGYECVDLHYKSYRILSGKPKLPNLPATFGKEGECITLEITCVDHILMIEVILVYTVFEQLDVITRSVRVVNKSKEELFLNRILSLCLDMDNRNYDVMNLPGAWGRERHIQRNPIQHGKFRTESSRGESSHQDHPFIAILDQNTTMDEGEIYGFNFVYSGNFLAQAEMNQFDSVRLVMGINPEQFRWKLGCNAENNTFTAPEVVCVYSDKGIGQMTRVYHDLYRNHLIRSKWNHLQRPVLINNWEATLFDFDSDKLLAIAKEASKCGIEMLVMDDGWFGERNDDTTSLGDWIVNENKIYGGLDHLVREVNKLGMKFGIWFEPEMISPNSELYRKNPDWAISIPNRDPIQSRFQLVLDFSRKDVTDYIYDQISSILNSTNISYVKWDMNRAICSIGSAKLPSDRQGELCHRYMLGVYDIQERLISNFPDLLLENCSSGGARYDAGMLYYSPQIWCSDDTDAYERLMIQEGTSMIYPLSTMGAHISDCPNQAVGRTTDFETRFHVAMAGTFGYELDITKLNEKEKLQIPEQVRFYHTYNDLIREGDYYRITSCMNDNNTDSWIVVSKNKEEGLFTYIQVKCRPNYKSRIIRLKGLGPDTTYEIIKTGTESTLVGKYKGSTLMNAGILIQEMQGDYKSLVYYLKSVK